MAIVRDGGDPSADNKVILTGLHVIALFSCVGGKRRNLNCPANAKSWTLESFCGLLKAVSVGPIAHATPAAVWTRATRLYDDRNSTAASASINRGKAPSAL